MTTIEFDLKEYLEKEFKGIRDELTEINTELKEHRKIEQDIVVEISKLKTHFKWLTVIGVAIVGVLVKQFFFP